MSPTLPPEPTGPPDLAAGTPGPTGPSGAPSDVVGLLHPGQMGASIGAALVGAGVRVLWASEGRSPATHRRAEAAGLVDVVRLDRLTAASTVVLVICPPSAAVDTARSVARAGCAGIYVDANAIAPATASGLAATLNGVGARFVDGDVIGGPVHDGRGPRLYLSGREAPTVAQLFAGTPVSAVVLGDGVEASALKACYAAWTKGTAALLLAIRAVARASGVEAALLAEWAGSQPDLAGRSEGALGAAGRGWRYAGEMEEIAAAFDSAGLPDGFALAAAEVYDRLAAFKDGSPPLDEVLAALLDRGGSAGRQPPPGVDDVPG